MPHIFGKLWHLALIWAIRKAFQCILQGVRILLAKYTRISPTSENYSYPLCRWVPVMIETGASPLQQHRIPAHPAHRRLIIGGSDSRLSWNRLWASPRPARPPRYLWSIPVPTPRALKPPVVVHSLHKQPGPGRALTCAPRTAPSGGRLQWAPECWPRWAPRVARPCFYENRDFWAVLGRAVFEKAPTAGYI